MKITPKAVAKAALPFAKGWENTETSGRRVAEWAAERLKNSVEKEGLMKFVRDAGIDETSVFYIALSEYVRTH